MQKGVIELGKALVKELDIELGNDTLTKWIAHYIAELLIELDNAGANEKRDLQQLCFESILTLWSHRSSFENGRRPFENFEPILRTLKALDPENQQTYYSFWQQEQNDSGSITYEVKQWTEFASRIDAAARVWIKFAIDQAVQHALDEKTYLWLNRSVNLMADRELELIIKLMPENSLAIDNNDINKINSARIKQLEGNLEKLDAFIELSNVIKADIANKLEALKNPGS
ncbi:MAG: hypothetical protein ABSB19_00660 [Methylomonas sp.]